MGRETGLAGENAPRPMAFRDSWHRALVYFGLGEEYHDDYDEPPAETEIEDRYRERPNVRRLRLRRGEFDDIFADHEPAAGRWAAELTPASTLHYGDPLDHVASP